MGNGLDGEPIGPNADGTPTGDGTSGGDYLVNFVLDNPTSIPPTPFERLNPAGSLVFSSVGTEGLIFDATDEDFITLSAQAGETIAAAVTFEQPVVGTVELAGVSDTIVGTAGQTVYLPPAAISADGLFDLRISADGPSRYTVDIYLNAGIEGEVGDSSDGNELALDGTFVGAGTGRFAVVGSFDGSSPDIDEYTLNLSGKSGTTLDIVLAGNGVNLSAQTLELLGPSGTVVATASGSYENFDRGILDFVVPPSAGDNVYTLRVSSHVPGQYTLTVVDWQTFDAEPNNESAARSLDDDGRAIGYLTADQGVVIEPDDYPVNTVLDTAVGGVTLSEFSTGNSVFAALAATYIPPTGTQVFGNETAGPAGWILGGGEMRADFDTPVSAVSIAFGSNSPLGDTVALLALDDDDNILEILSVSAIPPNSSETLSIVRPQRDIYAVAAAGLVDRAPVDRMTFSAVIPDTVDVYRVEANAGDVIKVSTATPFDLSSGVLGNSLDPELKVVHPDGNTVVASDMNGLDGKNASVTFIASVAGTYTIEVRATSGLGEYLLELDRATPDAIDDALVAPQGGTVTLLDSNAASVLANDLGLIDAPVKVVLETPPAHAANFSLNADGTFSYEHDGSQEFSDNFTYKLVDYNGDSDVASVSVTITPSETSIPDATDDAINIGEGGTATQLVGGETTLQANDLHLDDVPIVVSIETSPAYASSFAVNPDGTFSYQHDGSENFIDSFSYRVTDTNGDFDTATVTVAITPVSDSTPDAITDAITVIKGGLATQVNGGGISLLDNDIGLEDTPIAITVETEPAHAASFAINPDGTFSYQHDGGEGSLDVFIYRITDNDGEFDLATVTVAITPASNSNPDAIEDAITVDEGNTTTQLDSGESSLLANDAGLDDAPITVDVETPPAHAASFAINADGTFSYTHDGSENLADSFVYRVTDSDGDFDTALVAISVNPVSDTTPVAVDDAIAVVEGDAATMLDSGETSLLANDFGLSDVPIVIAVETPPSHAADFQILDDGTFSYTHDGSPNFVDSFVYRITDNDGQSDSAIVAITITPLDDTIPNAINDTINVDEGAVAVQLAGGEASLLANDFGLQDVPILVVVETPPLHAASFEINDDGTFRYEHDGSENFSDSFVYRITDNSGKSDTASVFVSITPVSDATPDAMDDSLSVIEGDTATQLDSGEFTLLANDVGLDDSPIEITVESPPSHAADFIINSGWNLPLPT